MSWLRAPAAFPLNVAAMFNLASADKVVLATVTQPYTQTLNLGPTLSFGASRLIAASEMIGILGGLLTVSRRDRAPAFASGNRGKCRRSTEGSNNRLFDVRRVKSQEGQDNWLAQKEPRRCCASSTSSACFTRPPGSTPRRDAQYGQRSRPGDPYQTSERWGGDPSPSALNHFFTMRALQDARYRPS
jgi:hypothetical protein